jgi:hypothetical protein
MAAASSIRQRVRDDKGREKDKGSIAAAAVKRLA